MFKWQHRSIGDKDATGIAAAAAEYEAGDPRSPSSVREVMAACSRAYRCCRRTPPRRACSFRERGGPFAGAAERSRARRRYLPRSRFPCGRLPRIKPEPGRCGRYAAL
ncbi:hypothetical protein MRX96_046039 [Rhipicephalus microplus]